VERNPTCFLAHDLAMASQFLIIRFCRHSTVLSTTPSPRATRRFWPTACECKYERKTLAQSLWYAASTSGLGSGKRVLRRLRRVLVHPMRSASTATPARERKSLSIISPWRVGGRHHQRSGCRDSRHTSSTVFLATGAGPPHLGVWFTGSRPGSWSTAACPAVSPPWPTRVRRRPSHDERGRRRRGSGMILCALSSTPARWRSKRRVLEPVSMCNHLHLQTNNCAVAAQCETCERGRVREGLSSPSSAREWR
jgi:hypothetical protein